MEYYDSDDGMLLVTVCETDEGEGNCQYQNESSTSVEYNLIAQAFPEIVVCDDTGCELPNSLAGRMDEPKTWYSCFNDGDDRLAKIKLTPKILESESVEYDVETIATIIDACYPDIRRVINYLQKQSINGKLNSNVEELQDSDYKLKLIELLGDKSLNKKDAFVSIRKLLMKNKVRDFTPLFSLLYDRLDKLTNENGKKAELILLLARYQNMDSMAVDKEINIMAMFVEMLGVLK